MIFHVRIRALFIKEDFLVGAKLILKNLKNFCFCVILKIVYYIGGTMSEGTKLMLGLAGIIFLPFILMLFNFIWNKVEDFIEKRRKKK